MKRSQRDTIAEIARVLKSSDPIPLSARVIGERVGSPHEYVRNLMSRHPHVFRCVSDNRRPSLWRVDVDIAEQLSKEGAE